MPNVEWKFDGGNVVTIIILLLGMAATYGSTATKLDFHALELERLDIKIAELSEKISSIQAEQARTRQALLDRESLGKKSTIEP